MLDSTNSLLKKETKTYIKTVIATEEYKPYYSYLCNMVGALISSFNIQQRNNNVNDCKEEIER